MRRIWQLVTAPTVRRIAVRQGRSRFRHLALALLMLLGLVLAAITPLAPPGLLAAERGTLQRGTLQRGTLPQGTPERPLPLSSEALANRSRYSQPGFYPISLIPDQSLYKPHAAWMGRLVLPDAHSTPRGSGNADDWVWIDVEQAPPEHRDLVGRRLRLSWAEEPRLRALVETVSTPVRLCEAAATAAAQGNVVPSRLDGRESVGPLQSLAGARPGNTVSVRLEGVTVEGNGLRIRRPPVQTTGRWMALVTVLGPAEGDDPDLWEVAHFDRAGGRFDGPRETIRIPLLPPDRFGRIVLDPRGLADSPLNPGGWRIFGSPGDDGVFTVQSLQPHQLTRLRAERQVRGLGAGLAAIHRDNWSPEALQRGSLHSSVLIPAGEANLPMAQEGQRALLLHLFGGIGGRNGEPHPAWTVTGHFAFGEGRVVRDPLSGELELDLLYHQIYANNPNGIVSGSQDWSAYAGSLQRGWMGTRPISDVLVPLDGALLDLLALQAEVLSARYRTGDGTGVALVTPSTSCVQDSSQALWIALDWLRQLERTDQGRNLLGDSSSRTARLAGALDALLTPFGMVRADWRHNADVTLADVAFSSVTHSAGTGRRQSLREPHRFVSSQRISDALLSWRSMLPRRAHDGLATVFWQAGLPLWILRTNQIPGADPNLEPVAPTTLLGQLPVLGTLLQRLIDGLFPPLPGVPLALSLLVLAVYAALALGLGFRSGFLKRSWRWPRPARLLRRGAALLLMPALVEELLFRGLLLPHPLEGVPLASMAAWGALSVGLFVLYHPIAARLWYPQGRRAFDDPRFLLQCALLGVACVVAYVITGSLWSAVGLHWLAVVVWLEPLGGAARLEHRPSQGSPGHDA